MLKLSYLVRGFPGHPLLTDAEKEAAEVS